MKMSSLVAAVAVTTCLACGSNDEADASSASELNAEAAVPENTRFVQVTSFGGGAAPAGSDCLPGQESYGLDLPTGRVSGLKCEPEPNGVRLRTTSYRGTLTPSQIEGVRQAARAVVVSQEDHCASGKSFVRLRVRLEGAPADALHDSLYDDASLRCGAHYGHYAAHGDELFAAVRSAAATSLTPSFGIPLEPVAPPSGPIWDPAATRIGASTYGSGGISPLGSTCLRGQVYYWLDLERGILAWNACEGSDHLALQHHERHLAQEELAAIARAGSAVKASTATTCREDSALFGVTISTADVPLLAYWDDGLACAAPTWGGLRGTFVTGLDGVFAELRAAAHE